MRCRLCFVLLALLMGGALLTHGFSPALSPQPSRGLDDSEAVDPWAGLMGGFRPLVSDLLWLRAYAAWERKDEEGWRRAWQATLRVAPDNAFYWLNGIQMLAYDIPRWGWSPLDVQRRAPAFLRIRQQRGEEAFQASAEALQYHPQDHALLLERAMIAWHVLEDKALAAAAFRDLWEAPGGPYFAARLHGELLRELGRPADALRWYLHLLPQLPEEEPAAARAVVLERIADLQAQLALPEGSLPAR